MTIGEALAKAAQLRPHQYDRQTMVRWLSNLDGMIYREMVQTHRRPIAGQMPVYTEEADDCQELLVPEPYAYDVYMPYLYACIDRENSEWDKYNQDINLYNQGYMTWCNDYKKRHEPLQANMGWVF